MPLNNSLKRTNLGKAGLFNSNAHRVQDPLFLKKPEFFDSCDKLQVQYELVRARMVDGHNVVDVCSRFGVSRQTFYTLQDKFSKHGTAGLLRKKPGPQGPSKWTEEIFNFTKNKIENEPQVSGGSLRAEIEKTFGVRLHRRTVEREVRSLNLKKNFSAPWVSNRTKKSGGPPARGI